MLVFSRRLFLQSPLSLYAVAAMSTSAGNNAPLSCATATNILKQYPIGLGTYEIPRDTLPRVIRQALQVGYRRIDCAAVYFNEDIVGDAIAQAIQDGIVERSDLYMVSKLASPFHRKEHVELALRKTLNDLRLDYLDLYLIHWPVAFHYVPIDPSVRGYPDEEIDESDGGRRIDPSVSIHETWHAMEELVDKGLVREIGVSNFPVSLLHELLTHSRITPAVNQCEGHVYLQQTNLLKYCQARGVQYQAYSPLGTPGYKQAGEPTILDDPVLQKIALRHNVSSAQVAIAWALQRGTSVVAKSSSEAHLRDNLAATQVQLTDADMQEIATLDRNYRFFRPDDWWPEYQMNVFD